MSFQVYQKKGLPFTRLLMLKMGNNGFCEFLYKRTEKLGEILDDWEYKTCFII